MYLEHIWSLYFKCSCWEFNLCITPVLFPHGFTHDLISKSILVMYSSMTEIQYKCKKRGAWAVLCLCPLLIPAASFLRPSTLPNPCFYFPYEPQIFLLERLHNRTDNRSVSSGSCLVAEICFQLLQDPTLPHTIASFRRRFRYIRALKAYIAHTVKEDFFSVSSGCPELLGIYERASSCPQQKDFLLSVCCCAAQIHYRGC